MSKHRHAEAFQEQVGNLGSESVDTSSFQAAEPALPELAPGDAMPTEPREVRQFTAKEAYNRIANILKRTPAEARAKVIAAANQVIELG